MADSYQDYIHEKLKKMSLMERVNAQSNQIQVVQKNQLRGTHKRRE